MSTATENLKAKLRAKAPVPAPPDFAKGLSLGHVLGNLAVSGRPDVGLLPGHVYVMTGGSQAGKTWQGRQLLAEASINSVYDEYRLVDDNPERGALMSDRRFFGERMADRLEQPSKRGHSRTLEEFYDNVQRIAKEGKPFIYLLDSEDALVTESELARVRQNSRARDSGDERKGSMGMEKAKGNSFGLRLANNSIEDTGSILIVIKQSRRNVNPFTSRFQPDTRSGGLALGFYASVELWFKVREKIRKKILGKSRIVGSRLRIHVAKNRVEGRDREVVVDFYPSHGIDDVGSQVRWLIDEGKWKETEGKIDAPEFRWTGSAEGLVRKIEKNDLERELALLTADRWQEIEEAVAVQRKPRYV